MNSTFGLIALCIILAATASLLIIREIHLRSLNVRVAKAVGAPMQGTAPLSNTTEWVSSLGARYRRFYSPENLDQMRAVLQSSGFNPHRTMSLLIGGKTVAMFLFPMLGVFAFELWGSSLGDLVTFVVIGVVIGIMGPRLFLWRIRRRFNAAVQRGTPDAIDLLVVCSQAGLGFESALMRVAEETKRSNPSMAKVLELLLDDLRVLSPREAFENLGQRSTTDGLRRFATMVNQSLQYGTALSHVLRTIAEELRRERIIKLEERAHKLGVKLIVPMVLFLMPAMFVILGGSSFLHLVHAFDHILPR